MSKLTTPPGGRHPRMSEAVLLTMRMAEQEANNNRQLMAFARPARDSDWQESEYKLFFLKDIYGMLTGADSACYNQIRNLAVTPQAAHWIGNHCANAYWFWALIGASCMRARTLPLMLDDIQRGAQTLFNMHAEPMARSIGASGWPTGYSGGYAPWHTRDALTRGTLWNNDQDREWGLKYGFLLLQRSPVKKLGIWRARRLPALDGMALIFNPLFDHLAATPPVVAAE